MKITPSTLCLWNWGFHVKPVFLLNTFIGDLHFVALIIGTLLDLPNYWLESWRRYNFKDVGWCINEDMGS